MIYVTSDCHADLSRFEAESFPEQKEITKDDYVIVCGDFSMVWDLDHESEWEKEKLDWMEEKPFTTLFCDGNHENFDRLYDYPVEMWHGGKVHKIRPHVIHLMRGQVYDIEGKTFFVMGGASSTMIPGGIREKGTGDADFVPRNALDPDSYVDYHVEHEDWWKEELPSEKECREGLRNLGKYENTVDYIISHCASNSTQIEMKVRPDTDIATDYLEQIKNTVAFGHWYFGHYHREQEVNEKETCLYKGIRRIV